MEWKDSEREDLNMIPEMQEAGYTVNFNFSDHVFKRLIPEFPPVHAVYFTKENVSVWQVINEDKHILRWKKQIKKGTKENPTYISTFYITLKVLLAEEKLLKEYSALEI